MDNEDKEYYIAIKEIDEKEYVIYESEMYKLSEIDIINLIKVCLVERRNQKIGNKLLEVYKDSTKDRHHITNKRLDMIGLKSQNGKPTNTKSTISK